MNSIEQYQNHLKQHGDATMASASDLAKHFQAIAAAHADYAKRSFKEGAALFEKLASAKSLQKAIEIRTEYTKTGYETFVAESKRIAEMYNELSKIALKPFGGMNRENVSSHR
jgi:phasin family protein